VDLIPLSARKVLDIGCGAGRLGEALKARQPAEVVGLECVEEVARVARGRLDQVFAGDVEQLELPFPPGSFDVVVCGDVLEHLRNPAHLLERVRRWLRPEGRLVASIPNTRHHSVVTGLLEGNWTYEPAGLLDATHLRFFTRREIEKLLYRAGFAVQEVRVVPGPGYDEWQAQGFPGEVQAGRLQIRGLAPQEAEEFYAYQYLLSAAPVPKADNGLTSIVILTHNQLAYTRLCVDSIRQYTDEPYELIFVDNASRDATVTYLQSLRCQGGVKVLTNRENRGFPAASNQGIQAAAGSQILLLNNDCVVTTGWLGRMLRALHSDPHIGLVGPCSNCVSGEQQVPVRYDDLSGLDGFAWDWGKANNRLLSDSDRLIGFCLLIRREVVNRIGLLDERFGIGCFEDDDYCRRALRAGFRAVIARDSFVHHFGGRTFLGSGVDFAGLMERNQELFRSKWEEADRPPEAATPPRAGDPEPAPSPFTVRVAPGGGLLLERAVIRLSLCMIVRDNARTIEACLRSIRPWVDEMVVVDTGSQDETPQIAERLGAHVYHFSWCDSFSAARNESLRHARGAWLFWMDSDDTINAANGRKLRDLVAGATDPAILGYVVQVHCPGPGEDGRADVTVVDHLKLFRNLPELRFEGRIHEQVLPSIRRAGGQVGWTDLFVVHSGYDHSPEGQERKKQRDLHLLRLELQEQPDHPFTLFNLGMTYADIGQYEEATGYLRRSIERSGEGESHLRKAYALLVHCHAQLQRPDEAWEICTRGLRLFPRDAELQFRKGILLHAAGRLPESVQAYQELLATDEDRHFASLDRGIRGFKARHNLALVYEDMGDLARAEEEWRLVVEEVAHYRPGWRGLGNVLLRQGKHQEAGELADRLLSTDGVRAEGRLLKGQLAAAQGDLPSARRELEATRQECPEDIEPLRTLCRVLFEHGDPDAEQVLVELTRREPHDASAHHNLGTVYLRTGRPQEAVEAYRQSLRLRPDNVETHFFLGNALRDSGRPEEAVMAWEYVLRLAPDHAGAAAALQEVRRTVA
jgi:GT2 family glycosyltransferase/tetratricopeptide (TPR) repeat protein/SAM-dependent methyltransferase